MERGHSAVRWLILGFVLLILSLSTLAQSNPVSNPLPPATGPYHIGTSLFHWVDETRYETIPAIVSGNPLQVGSAAARQPRTAVKAEATNRSDTVARLNTNQPVTVIELDGRWAHIEYSDVVGWVQAVGLFNVDTAPENKRELMVQVWYPADVEAGTAPAPYLADSELMVREFNIVVNGMYDITLAPDLAPSLEFQSYTFPDAPISNHQTGYPVLIFSHGLGAFPMFYSAQLEEMASHGYIVFAIYLSHLSDTDYHVPRWADSAVQSPGVCIDLSGTLYTPSRLGRPDFCSQPIAGA